MSLGYGWKEIDDEVGTLNSDKILGGSGLNMTFLNIPRMTYGLLYNQGINDGTALETYLKRLLVRKSIPPNINFHRLFEITNIDLKITATCLDTKSLVVFDHANTPNISVVDAIKASSCIPFIFMPNIINGKRYIDGGLINNFPLGLVDNTQPTLGLRLCVIDNHNYDQLSSNTIGKNGWIEFINELLEVMLINSWKDEHNIRSSLDFNDNITDTKVDILSIPVLATSYIQE